MTSSRRPGRPPLDPTDRSVPVGVSLPSKVVANLREQAQRAGVTLPELIRRQLRDESDDDE